MRKLIMTIALGFAIHASASAQYLLSGKDLYVGIGAGSTQLEFGRGGAAYLGIGVNDIGAMLYMAGDGRVSHLGEDRGSGKVGLMASYNALGEPDGLNIQVLAGMYGEQIYYAYGSKGENLHEQDPNRGKAQHESTKLFVGGGVKIGYKFMELTLLNEGTIMFGFKLSR